jgi:peptidoglycan/LPS O-acetylase OafA/YrhL
MFFYLVIPLLLFRIPYKYSLALMDASLLLIYSSAMFARFIRTEMDAQLKNHAKI